MSEPLFHEEGCVKPFDPQLFWESLYEGYDELDDLFDWETEDAVTEDSDI